MKAITMRTLLSSFVLAVLLIVAPAYIAAQQVLWDQQPDTDFNNVIMHQAEGFLGSTYIVNDVDFQSPVVVESVTTYFSNFSSLSPAKDNFGVLNIFDGDALTANDDPVNGGDFGPGQVVVDVIDIGNDVLSVTASGLNIPLAKGKYWFGLTPITDRACHSQTISAPPSGGKLESQLRTIGTSGTDWVGTSEIILMYLEASFTIRGRAFPDCAVAKTLLPERLAAGSFGRSVAVSGATAIVGSNGSPSVYDTTSGNLISTLQANDGAAGFGNSVSISGTTAIVGAPFDDDNGINSGSAYLFDTITGQQIAKLLADDGEALQRFGWSVSISGTTAIVGAPRINDCFNEIGSAYLFDIVTGQQLFKLTPNDGPSPDAFGLSVSISGTTAIVGAPLDDFIGSAYLFDTSTGQQIAKLVTNDGVDAGRQSVSISDTTAIVRAAFSPTAYVFDTSTGQQITTLLANDGAAVFGRSVSISGTTAIVGAANSDDSGSAYLFDTSTGQQIDKLLPNDSEPFDGFGGSVGISGTTVVVGASGDDDLGLNRGAAYVFNATTGQQTEKLLSGVDVRGDAFGRSVAIDGLTGVVGAEFADENGSDSGAAYVYDASGVRAFDLIPNDGAAGDRFGLSCTVDGTTAIVGAPFDSDNGIESGSAYVFDTKTGQQIAKLLPTDGAANARFGFSAAVEGRTTIVGAYLDDDNGLNSGAAYLFDTVTGSQIAKLVPNDTAAGDQFGISVGISGNIAIIGSYLDDVSGSNSGSVYLFDIVTGTQIAKLIPGDGAAGDQFGRSVAISGNTAIVGAHLDDDNGTDSGAVYVFNIGTGTEVAKWLPADGEAGELFGIDVAIDGFTAIAGAYFDNDNGPVSGSAYLFDIPTNTQITKLADSAEGDLFGFSVSISGTAAFVGAVRNDTNGVDSGAAYLYDFSTCDMVTTFVDPFSFTVFRGIQLNGSLADVAESDDNRVALNPGFVLNDTEAPVWLIFNGALSNDSPTSLEISVESQAGTPGLTCTIEAWNWTTKAYDVVDVTGESFNTDTIKSASITTGISNYVISNPAGGVRSRIGWRQTGFTLNFPWEVRLDQTGWIVQ